jgi:hypothetical protein
MFGAARTELYGMGLRGGCDSLVLRKKLDLSTTSANSFFMPDPDCWSAIPVRTQRVVQLLQVLGSPTCPSKFLKTLVIFTLKRHRRFNSVPGHHHFKGLSGQEPEFPTHDPTHDSH